MKISPVGITISQGTDLTYYNAFSAYLAEKKSAKEKFDIEVERPNKEKEIIQFFKECKSSDNSDLHSKVLSDERINQMEQIYVCKKEDYKLEVGASLITLEESSTIPAHKVCVLNDHSLHEELENSKKESEYQKKLFSVIAPYTHELRNPLHGILGILEFIFNSLISEELKKQCKIGINTGHLMMMLINDILDISQIHACKFKLTEEIFDAGEMIRECIEIMKFNYDGKGIELRIKVVNMTIIKNDKSRYKQVIINLLSNALKFTPRGYVKVTAYYDEQNKKLITKVKDTGEGIKEEEQNKIFSEFCKLEQQNSKNPRGIKRLYLIVL